MSENQSQGITQGKTLWGPTFKLNFIRTFALGLILGPGMAISHASTQPGMMIPLILMAPIIMPFCWLTCFLPFALCARGIEKFLVALLPGALGILCAKITVGIFVFWMGAIISLGDPLVYALHKWKPELLEIKDPKFFSFHVIIYVTEEVS